MRDKLDGRNKVKVDKFSVWPLYGEQASDIRSLPDGSLVLLVGSQRALRAAVAAGHVDVVRELLADERVDPTAFDNFALKVAASCGLAEIVALLLTDEQLKSSFDPVAAISSACAGGHLRVVESLLSFFPEDTDLLFEALVAAAAAGHVSIIDSLLTHRFGDSLPASAVGEAIEEALIDAVVAGHELVVKRLLAEPRLPARACQSALFPAIGCGRVDLLQLLLARPGTAPGVLSVDEAVAVGNVTALQLLLDHPSLADDWAPLLRGSEAPFDIVPPGVTEVLPCVARCGPLELFDSLIRRMRLNCDGAARMVSSAFSAAAATASRCFST